MESTADSLSLCAMATLNPAFKLAAIARWGKNISDPHDTVFPGRLLVTADPSERA